MSRHDDNFIDPPDSLSDAILRRVRGAAKKERWGRSILKIAWTAGPVTYLALQGGYLIGYGKSAPNQVFIYFAGYTLVAGIFALIVRFLYNLTRGGEHDEDRRSLERLFDRLPDRIIEIRDLQLAALDPYGRKVLAAKYLLENPDAGADAVATALMDLTGDAKIAAQIRDVEVYRRFGLSLRAEEKSEWLKSALHDHGEELNAASQEVSRLVWQRASGSAPSKRIGRARTRGFIGRTLAANEQDNLNLMSLIDAEEICVLVYELISGRRFPQFQVRYYGNKAYTESARRLAHSRREYRSAVFVRNSRLRVLAEHLYAGPKEKRGWLKSRRVGKGIRRVLASLPQIRSARLLQETVVEAMNELVRSAATGGSRDEQRRVKLLKELYLQLRKASDKVERGYRQFKADWERYVTVMQKREQAGPVRLLHNGETGRGVRLQLRRIGLETKSTLPAARLIEEKLEEFTLEHEESLIKTNDQKELAVDLLQILDRFLPLGESQVQRAIESTNSAYLISLEKNMTVAAKQSWGLALVSEVDSPLREGIHETIRSLVEYDRLELREADFEELEKRFGADREYLAGLASAGRHSWSPEFDVPPPVPVPPLPGQASKAVRKSS